MTKNPVRISQGTHQIEHLKWELQLSMSGINDRGVWRSRDIFIVRTRMAVVLFWQHWTCAYKMPPGDFFLVGHYCQSLLFAVMVVILLVIPYSYFLLYIGCTIKDIFWGFMTAQVDLIEVFLHMTYFRVVVGGELFTQQFLPPQRLDLFWVSLPLSVTGSNGLTSSKFLLFCSNRFTIFISQISP